MTLIPRQIESASFEELLDTLGVRQGGVYFVHSNWDRMEFFGLSYQQVIETLQSRIGEEGLLCFPTYPWIYKYHPVLLEIPYEPEAPFSTLATPSRMGLLTEIFRRFPGVYRGAHPWVPVAVWGKSAEALVDGVHTCSELYGSGSCFGRLLERDVQVLGLGVSVGTSSFSHYPDWLMREEVSFSSFETLAVKSVELSSGTIEEGLRFEIVPEHVQKIFSPKTLFEQDRQLQDALTFVSLEGNFFFAHSAAAFTEAALREYGQLNVEVDYPCWFMEKF